MDHTNKDRCNCPACCARRMDDIQRRYPIGEKPLLIWPVVAVWAVPYAAVREGVFVPFRNDHPLVAS